MLPPPPESWHPHLGEILDPPLLDSSCTVYFNFRFLLIPGSSAMKIAYLSKEDWADVCNVTSYGFLPSATVFAERLCFHRCLPVHGGGEVYTPLH